MPNLCIQFQPDRVDRNSAEGILAAFHNLVPAADVVSGDQDGRYVNITFKAESAAGGWATVKTVLDLPEFGRAARRSCIVTCEGDHGWNDYLLLHHYDRTLVIDDVPSPLPEKSP